ncbi:MAG: RNA polymerase sigma factor [Flagellimonas sp.]
MKRDLGRLTDEELMERASKGCTDALSLIFNRYKAKVFNFLFQMSRNRNTSEELTQETFYKVIKYKKSYRGGRFSSWLFKIARNIYYDHYRTRNETLSFEPIEFALGTFDSEVFDDNIGHLMNVLNNLKKEDREIIIMNRIQKMKYAEIARIIESNEVAVKSRVHRIIRNMRDQFFKSL